MPKKGGRDSIGSGTKARLHLDNKEVIEEISE
jgi:hypothetical protein